MSALLTDLYQLTMLQAYLDEGLDGEAVFELFVRKLPPQRSFLVAAGLEQALEFLETLAFTPAEIDWLRSQGFAPHLLDHLRSLRFTGDVDAMPEAPASSATSRSCASPRRCRRRSWWKAGCSTSSTSRP